MRLKALQTRVDSGIERLAKEAAAREGEDVSNWLRRLVMRELRPTALIEAWTLPTKDPQEDGLNPDRKAEFFLAPFRESPSGDRDFIIYLTPTARLTEGERRDNGPFWDHVERRWIFLRSSPTPWKSMGQMQYLDRRIVLTLRRVM